MSRLEELFMQIFDRKDRIIHQMSLQWQSYNESVAINFAATGGGGPPPSCIWAAGDGPDALGWPLSQGFGYSAPTTSSRPPVSPKFLFDQKSVLTVGGLTQNLDVEPAVVAPCVPKDLDGSGRLFGNEISNTDHIVGDNAAVECCTNSHVNVENYSGPITRSRASSIKLGFDFEKGINGEDYNGSITRSGSTSMKLDSEHGTFKSSNCSDRVTRSRKSSAQLCIEKQLLGSNSCADQVTTSTRSSPKLDFENGLLGPSSYAGRMTRSRTSSAKIESEKQSLNVNNFVDFTSKYDKSVDQSQQKESLLVNEPIASVENSAKISSGDDRNASKDKVLQCSSKEAVSGTENVTTKKALAMHFTGKNGNCNNSTGRVTISKTSSNTAAIFPVEYGSAVDESRPIENSLSEEVIDGINNSNESFGEDHTNAGYNFEDVCGKVPPGVEHPYMHCCTQEPNESVVQYTYTNHRKGSTAAVVESSVAEVTDKTDTSPIQDALSETEHFLKSNDIYITGSAKSLSYGSEIISSGKTSMDVDAGELGSYLGVNVEVEKHSMEQTVVSPKHSSLSELDLSITRGSTINADEDIPALYFSHRAELSTFSRDDTTFCDSGGRSLEQVPQKNIKDKGEEIDPTPSEGQYFLRSFKSHDHSDSAKSCRSGDSFSNKKEIPCTNMTHPKQRNMDCPVDDNSCISEEQRLNPLQNADQFRPKRSSVFTSEPMTNSQHFCTSKKSMYETTNLTQSNSLENVQQEVIHHELHNVAAEITGAAPGLRNNFSSCYDVDLFCKRTSAQAYSNFSGYTKEETGNRTSSYGRNFSSQMGDVPNIIEAFPCMEGKKEEVITDTTDAVPDSIKKYASDDEVDLLFIHASEHKYSGCSTHLAGETQNGRSCGEVDFAAGNLKAVSIVGTKEGKEIEELRKQEVLHDSTNMLNLHAIENASPVYVGPSGAMEEKLACSIVSQSSKDSLTSLQKDVGLGVSVTSPEIEGFDIDAPLKTTCYNHIQNSQFPTSVLDNARMSEKLNTFMAVRTPFHCPSSKHKTHRLHDICHSLTDDFSSNLNFTNSLNFNRDDVKRLWSSECGKMIDTYENIARNGSDLSATNSQLLSIGFTFANDARRPVTPPVEKYSYKTNSNKNGSISGRVANPELICFRIDENASITGEDEVLDELEEIAQQGVTSSEAVVSSNRKVSTDATSSNENASTMLSTSQKCLDRASFDSVNTKAYMKWCGNDSHHTANVSSTRSNIEIEKNQCLSASVKKAAGRKAFRDKSGKPKTTLRVNQNKRQTSARKGSKPTNIVANISSFIPLVQQKQQAAAVQNGKREIKVKALEAAEAAKRQLEKKERDRKMKKEAARLERKRLEKEKLVELEQKKKDEKSKKGTQIESRKRQREEDGRKENQRKQRCVERTLRQHKEQDRTCAVDKELHFKDPEHKKEKPEEDTRKFQSFVNIGESSEANKTTNVNQRSSVKSCQEVSDIFNVDEKVTRKESCESQSYEISPYRDSDIDDDEDNSSRRKPIPLWARKESLYHLLHSQRHMDTGKIFSCRRSFCLNKVLSGRIRPRPFAQR